MISGISLFLGVESQGWTLPQFQIAAKNAKALGISALLVKIADGINAWYDGISGWHHVLETIKAQGVLAVPYTYCYGDKFRGLQSEIAILKEAMNTVGIVIADMEVEWNGQISWANTVSNALKDTRGIFAVTTWADPSLQNWQGVIDALKPCVDLWLPQVYSDYLASVYQQQFAGLPVIPVLNLGMDFGSNDVVQHAKDAQSVAIAFWEYQAASGAYASIVKEIVAMKRTSSVPSANQLKAANDSWDSVLKSTVAAPKGTGIYQEWLASLIAGTFYGPPLTREYDSVDWSGNPIVVQEFAHARCEWSGSANWYSLNGKL